MFDSSRLCRSGRKFIDLSNCWVKSVALPRQVRILSARFGLPGRARKPPPVLRWLGQWLVGMCATVLASWGSLFSRPSHHFATRSPCSDNAMSRPAGRAAVSQGGDMPDGSMHVERFAIYQSHRSSKRPFPGDNGTNSPGMPTGPMRCGCGSCSWRATYRPGTGRQADHVQRRRCRRDIGRPVISIVRGGWRTAPVKTR